MRLGWTEEGVGIDDNVIARVEVCLSYSGLVGVAYVELLNCIVE
jgi:hypothetical protein